MEKFSCSKDFIQHYFIVIQFLYASVKPMSFYMRPASGKIVSRKNVFVVGRMVTCASLSLNLKSNKTITNITNIQDVWGFAQQQMQLNVQLPKGLQWCLCLLIFVVPRCNGGILYHSSYKNGHVSTKVKWYFWK